MVDDVGLLVVIGVELDAALLHAHAAEVPRRVERLAAEVALHVRSPPSRLGRMQHPRLEAESQILVQASAQMRLAPRQLQVVERAEL
jgi:serine phosphatase RsbU (regulator of sigma subunit)